jgi:hypothetical protein
MAYIKFTDLEITGQPGFQPWHSTPPALMKVIADAAGHVPCVKDRVRAIFIDFI